MKNIFLIILFLAITVVAHSQQSPELILNDIGGADDVIIEMETNDDQASNFRNLILGVNESSHGWLRTMSNGSNQLNNDLSFWTDGKRRMSIIDSDLGINTTNPLEKIHLNSGSALITLDIINQNLQKGAFNFYDGSLLRSGISYSMRPGSSVRPSLDVSHLGNSKMALKTSGNAIEVLQNGFIMLPQLATGSDQNLIANNQKALTTETPLVAGRLNITPSHFREDNTFASMNSGPNEILPEYVTGRLGTVRMAAPINLPEGARIFQVEIHYIDNDPHRDVEVRLIESKNDSPTVSNTDFIFSSIGTNTSSNNPVLSHTEFFVSWTIEDPREYSSFVQIDMGSSNINTVTGISSIVLVYALP